MPFLTGEPRLADTTARSEICILAHECGREKAHPANERDGEKLISVELSSLSLEQVTPASGAAQKV